MRRLFECFKKNGCLSMAMLFLLASGCVSDSIQDRKIARYRPDTDSRDVSTWPPPSSPVKGGSVSPSTTTPTPPVQDAASWKRPLRQGDKIMIYLSGIPRPIEKPDIVDDKGNINLPYIGSVKIEGKTTSDAESHIEQAYIKGRYFKNITVTIVAQEDEYFIRGEVKRPGRYSLRPGLTLLQAISAASGYTEFAKKEKVEVTRGNEKYVYNAKKIDKGEEKDPTIKPGDNIVVARSRWF